LSSTGRIIRVYTEIRRDTGDYRGFMCHFICHFEYCSSSESPVALAICSVSGQPHLLQSQSDFPFLIADLGLGCMPYLAYKLGTFCFVQAYGILQFICD